MYPRFTLTCCSYYFPYGNNEFILELFIPLLSIHILDSLLITSKKSLKMNVEKILHITSSGRNEESVSKQVSNLVVDHFKHTNPSLNVIGRDVSPGLPFVDEEWINANFTPADDRSVEQNETLSVSDKLVAELKNADHIVIASPIYNFSIPASLKSWVDMIARAGQTFNYTENGPIGLLKDKKATIVIASGGVPVGSEMDMATSYLKLVLGFVGIHDVNVIDASTINYQEDKNLDSADTQIATLLA